jgi:hypothetical protein
VHHDALLQLADPRIADCGWLMMIGEAKSEPETP